MTEYSGSSDFSHGAPQRLGILLVNLGTPDSPQPADVRKFLAQFLWDPRVIEAPRWLWWLALHGVILRTRPAKSSHAYQQIWTPQGSPLLLHSRELAAKLSARLEGRLGSRIRVALGMTYGSPSIPEAMRELSDAGAHRLLVLPLYPQYTGTTTGPVFDQLAEVLRHTRWLPELRFLTNYHDRPDYIDAVAASIQQHWQTHERNHLLFSFHGIPRRYLLAGDPYHCQCVKTARLIAEKLQLAADEWSFSFQSQVGREEWLRPYTDELLIQYAKQGRNAVTIACPGFAVDCLETLEEIALRNRDAFLANGGRSYHYVPALNASDAHARMLEQLVLDHTRGWESTLAASGADAAHSQERALRMGAVR